MATYLHVAPALALAVALGPRRVVWRLALAGALCGVLPDADFVPVLLHLDSYNGTYGHRGFSHSITFALALGCLSAGLAQRRRAQVGLYLALCTLSHPLLDGLIDRGICNAWLWPLDNARLCLPWRPIPMRGVALFGAQRLVQELWWIGLPLLLLAGTGLLLRRFGERLQRGQPLQARAFPATPREGARAQRQRRVAAMAALAQQWRTRPGAAAARR